MSFCCVTRASIWLSAQKNLWPIVIHGKTCMDDGWTWKPVKASEDERHTSSLESNILKEGKNCNFGLHNNLWEPRMFSKSLQSPWADVRAFMKCIETRSVLYGWQGFVDQCVKRLMKKWWRGEKMTCRCLWVWQQGGLQEQGFHAASHMSLHMPKAWTAGHKVSAWISSGNH